MNKIQAETFRALGIMILMGTIGIAVVIWFITMSVQSTERERMKHETCMVVTDYVGEPSSRVVSQVTNYCGEPSQ